MTNGAKELKELKELKDHEKEQKESKDYEKEYVLQKHDNVHKAYVGFYISLLLGLTAIFFQIPFEEGASRALTWVIARDNFFLGLVIVTLFMLLITSIIAYLLNKTAEYETFLKCKRKNS